MTFLSSIFKTHKMSKQNKDSEKKVCFYRKCKKKIFNHYYNLDKYKQYCKKHCKDRKKMCQDKECNMYGNYFSPEKERFCSLHRPIIYARKSKDLVFKQTTKCYLCDNYNAKRPSKYLERSIEMICEYCKE